MENLTGNDGIESTHRVIQEEDVTSAVHGTSERDPLLLASTQSAALHRKRIKVDCRNVIANVPFVKAPSRNLCNQEPETFQAAQTFARVILLQGRRFKA